MRAVDNGLCKSILKTGKPPRSVSFKGAENETGAEG